MKKYLFSAAVCVISMALEIGGAPLRECLRKIYWNLKNVNLR